MMIPKAKRIPVLLIISILMRTMHSGSGHRKPVRLKSEFMTISAYTEGSSRRSRQARLRSIGTDAVITGKSYMKRHIPSQQS